MVERFLRKFYKKAREAIPWPRERWYVQVSGLKDEEKPFKESVDSECMRFMQKWEKFLSTIQGMSVNVKRAKPKRGGGKKLFELHATLFLDNGELFAKATDKDDLYSALMHVLKELEAEVNRAQSFKQEQGVPKRLKGKARLWRETRLR
ncbi:hypothetical protein H0N96_01310 [Candidatus Micrarchaeota archaeon]|nr:hypothetical protein [Candidatus Micrarchaeota archaeon]